MTTIAALTLSTMKADNNQHIQTEYITTAPSDAVKGSIDAITLECEQPLVKAAFHNLPPCDPIEISFKDVSYSVQKMFSKSEYCHYLSQFCSRHILHSHSLPLSLCTRLNFIDIIIFIIFFFFIDHNYELWFHIFFLFFVLLLLCHFFRFYKIRKKFF